MDAQGIRKTLEAEYDIPFFVQNTVDGGEPAFIIGPRDLGKELFTVKVYFRNAIRLYMDFLPQKYSAGFIGSMARQSKENKQRFLDYARLIQDNGAKITLTVNGSPLPDDDEATWPDAWKELRIHVTKMPVVEEGELNYTEAAYRWGSLLTGMILSLANIVPIEDEAPVAGYSEGTKYRTESNRYERNPLNRKLCLASKGYDCAICGFNFGKRYGETGNRFIHVHHIVPVSKLGPGYVIDPLKDLIPVCPNCHAMLHRTDPPMTPSNLKQIIEKERIKHHE